MPRSTRSRLRPPLPSRAPWWAALGLAPRSAAVGPYTIHWVEAGEGEPVVLLHGLSGSSRWWARNLPALVARHRVLVPDVIGFGRSRWRRPLPLMPELAGALAGWMELADAEAVHLVGHSMGGHLAVHIAARFPGRVRRLVLVDSAGIPRDLTARTVLRFAYEAAPPRRWGDPRFLPVIWRDALTAGPVVLVSALWNLVRDDVRPLLGQIQAPTLLLWGERDTIVPLEHGRMMREAIPGARLLVLKGAYHNPMVDRAADFDAALLAFLGGAEVGE
jgi:pimeloyl-ACP methyl ester carboxylesterase